MRFYYPLLATLGVLAGTVAHELTHWAVARLLGAEVHDVRLFPPRPRVVFDAPTPTVAAAIHRSTVVMSIPVATLGVWTVLNAPLPTAVAIGAAAAAYLPRSRSDWFPPTDADRDAAPDPV